MFVIINNDFVSNLFVYRSVVRTLMLKLIRTVDIPKYDFTIHATTLFEFEAKLFRFEERTMQTIVC